MIYDPKAVIRQKNLQGGQIFWFYCSCYPTKWKHQTFKSASKLKQFLRPNFFIPLWKVFWTHCSMLTTWPSEDLLLDIDGMLFVFHHNLPNVSAHGLKRDKKLNIDLPGLSRGHSGGLHNSTYKDLSCLYYSIKLHIKSSTENHEEGLRPKPCQ